MQSVWPPLPRIPREQRRGNSRVFLGGRVGEYMAAEGRGKEPRDTVSSGQLGLSCVTGPVLLGSQFALDSLAE